ncbi:hypothetical protein QBC46DRAFT_353627 [Diplogelasinospora grovesii]|uniref:Uncharacterized protein n=1 Tax=Diplogelasinospora grovesii TaxID=303347 RepID=A0AAN6N8B4_9PEZI|nr:hypothetical protein QBC46DRAFT_353627 [Diplogelasinospora grovesii]
MDASNSSGSSQEEGNSTGLEISNPAIDSVDHPTDLQTMDKTVVCGEYQALARTARSSDDERNATDSTTEPRGSPEENGDVAKSGSPKEIEDTDEPGSPVSPRDASSSDQLSGGDHETTTTKSSASSLRESGVILHPRYSDTRYGYLSEPTTMQRNITTFCSGSSRW